MFANGQPPLGNLCGVIFETERLVARPWTLEDVEAALAIYGDPEVMRGLSGAPVADLDEQRERLATVIGRFVGTPYGMWALETREFGVVGSVLLKPLPESEKIEVGWHLARAHWGNGYATEAGRGALEHGFSTVGLETIYAVAFGWNEPSLAVMRRLGMQRLGTTEEFYGHELEMYHAVRLSP